MSLLAGIRFSKKKGESTTGAAPAASPAPEPPAPTPAEAEKPAEESDSRSGPRKPVMGLYNPAQPDGGAGLPVKAPVVAVGDRGADWRARALKRAREQAEKSGKSIEEVVAERWGSVNELRGAESGNRGRNDGGGGRLGKRDRARFRQDLVALGRGEVSNFPEAAGGEGVIDRRERHKLRIGRDARDTDVLKRFGDKLNAAMEGLPRERDTDEDGGHRGGRGTKEGGNSVGSAGRRDADEPEPAEMRRRARGDSRERGERSAGMRSGGSGGGGGTAAPQRQEQRHDHQQQQQQQRWQQQQRRSRSASPERRKRQRAETQTSDGKERQNADADRPRRLGEDRRSEEGSFRGDRREVRREGEPERGAGGADGEKRARGKSETAGQSVRAGFEPENKQGQVAAGETDQRPSPPTNEAAQEMLPPEAPPVVLSLQEINALAAAAMRAKFKGDTATHARLTAEVERAKATAAAANAAAASNPSGKASFASGPTAPAAAASARDAPAPAGRSGNAERTDAEFVVITARDARGRPIAGQAVPAPLRREDLKSGARKGKLKQSRTAAVEAAASAGNGEDLQAYLRAERERGAGDMDKEFARNVMRLGSRYKGTELGEKSGGGMPSGFDEEDEVDTRMFEAADERLTEAAAQARQRQAAIAEHKRMEAATSGCALCVGSRTADKRLLISLGEKAALRLVPPASRLVEGHCRIAPLAHVSSCRACDEDVWEEIGKFKRALQAMATAEGDRVVFLETAVGLRNAPHAFIEAVPVPKDVEMDAPLYFKQALLSAGDEWSTHKKVIDTKPPAGIRGAVPESFPYFHVEWEGGSGFAQVVEDEDEWEKSFGLDVLAGMLGVDPPQFGRGGGSGGGGSGSGKRRRGGGRGGGSDGGEEETRQAALSFLEKWRKYDWTAELDGGEFVAGG